MNKINCIVIDSEVEALEKLRTFIRKVPFLNLTGCYRSPVDAVALIEEGGVDAMFIDIVLPELNGFDFIESLTVRPMVVFTSASADYAVASYKYSAVDYLLKPFDFAAFQRTANKLYRQKCETDGTDKADNEVLYVKVDYRYVNIRVSDIYYIKGMNEYIQIIVNDGKPLMTLATLKQLKGRLPAYFLQVHRSYIVNMREMKEMERMRILFPDGARIPVGDNYRKEFTDYLLSHSLNRGKM
ncbi:MAG: LytR/AlgR family response regulator transcription factor [Prevotella sp.]